MGSCGMREANLHVICADSLAQVEKRRKAPGCSSFWWWKKTPCIGRWISKGWRSLFPGCGHQLFSSALVAHVLLRRVGKVAMYVACLDDFLGDSMWTGKWWGEDLWLHCSSALIWMWNWSYMGDSWLKRPSNTETIPGFPPKKIWRNAGECRA